MELYNDNFFYDSLAFSFSCDDDILYENIMTLARKYEMYTIHKK